MKGKIAPVAAVLGAAVMLLAGAAQARDMQLTAQDYIDIQMLSARYSHVIEHCINRGYDYAALYTADGEFGRSDGWGIPPKDLSKGPDQLATAAGGGPNGCQPNWVGRWPHPCHRGYRDYAYADRRTCKSMLLILG